ncbi:MAG: flagellar filament capping protein FliD, partial [Vampirovibrionia bacterium]
ITQLLAIERAPIDLQEEQVTELQASKTYLDSVESRTKALDTAIQSFTDGNIAVSMDLFKQKSATSSDEDILTVTAGAKAVAQSFQVNVLKIATSTKVQSQGSLSPTGDVGSLVDASNTIESLSNGAGTAGTFTVFYNDTPTEITVNAGDTVGDILSNITAATGGNITGSIAGGQVLLQSAGGTITVGASGDTSNFLSATQLDIGTTVGNDLQSANSLSGISTAGTLVGNAANLQTGVTAGTFTIGTAEFTIDATTTLDSLLNDINNDSDANVSASYNLRTNKIEFVSKDPGKIAITLGASGDTSNFLDAVNLVNGADTLAYQTLGENAQIQINGGPTIESTSNTIKDSVTGLKDVTLELLDDSAGQQINVNVKQDTDQLVSKIETFIKTFNTLLSYIDTETDSETGHLAGDTALVRFRNNLRTKVTDIVYGNPLYSLASVGITTGDVGASGDPTSTLVFDEDKFLEALADNPDNVRALFLGDTTEGYTGIFEQLENYTDAAIDTVDGLFKTRDDAIDARIENLQDSIDRALERLDAKEELLNQQFAAMETAISTLNSQSSYLSAQSS